MSAAAARWTAIGLVGLCTALVMRARTTPAPVPASAPPREFSAERALQHTRAFAVRPHPSGSAEHARVREYLLAQLKEMGLEPQLQEATAVGTRYPTAGHVSNVMARVPGKLSGGKAVLLAAHYDGVGASPAAGDDGSGTSALLETLRALRAEAPLEHDVIALFTDGEEAGLLGAAAFVREHPWAKDVEVMLNFEARGTEGRAFMFETGAGNLDVGRVLSHVPDVTAGSLLVTVYRSLPNDTDLSEFSLLGKPALNFAFVDGVERYHTAHDDLAHLSAGSVQHHGVQMLALTRAFANGPLPRPATGDAIFFDAPFVGLLIYPESWGIPIAVVVALLTIFCVVRSLRGDTRVGLGVALGFGEMLVATGIGAIVCLKAGGLLDALHDRMQWDGDPSWRTEYALALILLMLAWSLIVWNAARRIASARALHAGALLLWTLLLLGTSVKLPGASYLFVWPTCAMAIAVAIEGTGGLNRAGWASRWIATFVACSLLVPVIFTTGAYTLPLNGPGGAAIGALVPMLAWLLAPHMESLGGRSGGSPATPDTNARATPSWTAAAVLLLAALASGAYGMVAVRRSVDYPATVNFAYVTSPDADSAFLTTRAAAVHDNSWTAAVLGASRRVITATAADSSHRWVLAALSSAQHTAVRSAPRLFGDAPSARMVADSMNGDRRIVTLHVDAPSGTLGVVVSGDSSLHAVAIDGRRLDGARYRRRPNALNMPFTAPPDSGFAITLDVPRNGPVTVGLAAMSPGLPPAVSTGAPARPEDIVAMQNGDVTVRYRRVRFP